MPEPIEYDILLNYQSALRDISVSGGYFYDVHTDAVSIDPADLVEGMTGTILRLPFFIVQIASGRTVSYTQSKQKLDVIPITITVAADAIALDPVSRALTPARLAADIEKALTLDITRGERVSDTKIVDKSAGHMHGTQRVFMIVETEVRLHGEYGKPNG